MGCGGCRGKNVISKYTNYTSDEEQKSPRLYPNGEIEFFEEPVPELKGYTIDSNNPMKLIPEGVGCAWRITGILMQKDGTYIPHHVCRHSKCQYKSKPVTFDICEACPFREL